MSANEASPPDPMRLGRPAATVAVAASSAPWLAVWADQATPTQALLAGIVGGTVYVLDASIRFAFKAWTISSTKRAKNLARIQQPS